MNSPLQPSGSPLEASARNKSFPYTVALLIAAHVIVIGGLLSLGCRPSPTPPQQTETPPPEPPPVVPPVETPPVQVADTNLPVTPTSPVVGNPGVVGSGTGPVSPPPVAVTEPVPPIGGTTGSEYKILRGDNAYNVAKRMGVSVKALMAANTGINWNNLKVGQVLQIPAGGSVAPGGTLGLTSTPDAPPAGGDVSAGTVHVVKAGDNLIRISKKYGVTKKAIWAANGLQNDNIKVGQKLKIPAAMSGAGGGTPPPPPGGTITPAPEPTATPLPTGVPR